LFIAGVLVGTTAAVLTAPRSGHDTREKIREFVEKEFDAVTCRCKDKPAPDTDVR